MAIYKYRAKTGPDKIVSDTMEADSIDEVVGKLTHNGYVPIQVEPLITVKETDAHTSTFFGSIKARDLNVFTRQLSSLIKSGVPLLKALNVISDQTESVTLRSIVSEIGRDVKDGKMFSEALKRYPNIFPPLFISLIRAGEDSGTLDNALIRLSEHREKMEEIKSRVRAAMVYPILLMVFGFLAVIFMITFVVPQIKSMFDAIRISLPLPTQILIGISTFMLDYWPYLLAAFFVLVIIIRGFVLIEKAMFDEFKLRLPIIGKFIQRAELGKFCRTLGLLIDNGIPILSAMEITIPTLSNTVFRNAFSKVSEGLRSGISFATGLKQNNTAKHFPPFMINMVAVGEESGRLDETLAEIATTYERDTEELIKIGLSLIEPVLLLIMGAVVGFIVIAMLLPMFSMGEMV
jgi:type II secretory pathway component PulF